MLFEGLVYGCVCDVVERGEVVSVAYLSIRGRMRWIGSVKILGGMCVSIVDVYELWGAVAQCGVVLWEGLTLEGQWEWPPII